MPMPQKFTAKERDNETGLDYFGARYYASMQGRFTGVDPISLTRYHIAEPQRWNGYTYAINNPLIMIDLNGKFPWTFQIRSFIYASTVAGGWYAGDGRGPSTADSPAATSRVRLSFTLDIDKSKITHQDIGSDPSKLLLPKVTVSKTGVPTVKFGDVQTLKTILRVSNFTTTGKIQFPEL
jgi:RHS repeat-associated protein